MSDGEQQHPAETELDRLLVELETFGDENDAAHEERQKKMLNLERPTAELIDLMLRLAKRRLVLEIGTSNGYSTIWLARALRDAGGTLATIERDAAKFAMAEVNLRRAGLQTVVTQHLGDATEIVRQLNVSFDCVFFDADRTSAVSQLKILMPRLAPDALLLADNANSHAAELEEYVAYVGLLSDFRVTVVGVGKGLHVAHRTA